MDGRRARGDARRAQLVDATLRVVERDGLAGLTHRAVAAEAGVPLASASYHFDGIADLAQAALRRANDDLVAVVAADRRPASPQGLARLLADEVARHHGRLIAEYELYLLAVRRPTLRAEALAWLDVVADRYAPELDERARRAFQALIEGICLHALLRPGTADVDEIEATLRAGWPGGARL
ncbi:TetR family transcriptional regulator [Patulibacter sp. SYSU D01012]|uniref:TetR/AcrR family transcriptional regulator n=1 Tax=Patulibacter sp. SYSU D01012 TaxID=2817381 RepID=UPI001B315F92|nr:TetR family transcriptional regulator [Patulibacter sp. SYSU D01012]